MVVDIGQNIHARQRQDKGKNKPRILRMKRHVIPTRNRKHFERVMPDIFAVGFIVFALGIIISEILVLENNLERTLEDIHKIRDLYHTDEKLATLLAYKGSIV